MAAGCGGDNGSIRTSGYAPKTATNVVDEGNGWISFDVHGERFLMKCGNNTPAIKVKE